LTVDRRRALWLTAIVLVAANLRPLITSVPPLVDRLTAEFGLTAVQAGALTTLPVVCMGLFAPVAAVSARRFGDTPVLAVGVALIAAGAGVRAIGGLPGLYTGTLIGGLGIAVAGALLPALVRSRMPDRVGPVTGLYTAALIGGALVAAASTEFLRAALGLSPTSVLALWAIPAVIALVAFLFVGGPASAPGRGGQKPWRSGAAWMGTLFMGAQSLLFYATLAWLAATYTDLGMSAQGASLLLGLFSATQVITAFAMPVLAHRTGDLRPWIAGSVAVTALGLLLIAVAPLASPWAWAALLGLGMGGNLSLALTVLTEAAPTPQAASAYTGMAFFGGYLLAAFGPVAAGALRDATGSFRPVFYTLAALGVLTLAIGVSAATLSRRVVTADLGAQGSL
jgi:MFS transporter, CP family, cyanate transporter